MIQYGHSVQLRLGDTTFDLTARAIYGVAVTSEAEVPAAEQAGADVIIVRSELAAVAAAKASSLPVLNAADLDRDRFVVLGDGPDRIGQQVAAMMAGARIFETTNVGEARRVGATVSELLKRRSVAT